MTAGGARKHNGPCLGGARAASGTPSACPETGPRRLPTSRGAHTSQSLSGSGLTLDARQPRPTALVCGCHSLTGGAGLAAEVRLDHLDASGALLQPLRVFRGHDLLSTFMRVLHATAVHAQPVKGIKYASRVQRTRAPMDRSHPRPPLGSAAEEQATLSRPLEQRFAAALRRSIRPARAGACSAQRVAVRSAGARHAVARAVYHLHGALPWAEPSQVPTLGRACAARCMNGPAPGLPLRRGRGSMIAACR